MRNTEQLILGQTYLGSTGLHTEGSLRHYGKLRTLFIEKESSHTVLRSSEQLSPGLNFGNENC